MIIKTILFILTLLLVSCSVKYEVRIDHNPYAANGQWYKGNTHTHTTNSDGDSPPDVVAKWYADHGYDFLVLTDHNHLTDPGEAGELRNDFLMIPGEEVSATFRSPFTGNKPVHINALDPDYLVEPVNGLDTMVETIQKNVDAINDANGVPHINHPNFRWAFSHPELLQIENNNLIEIHNGHPLVNNDGDADHPGMEMVWDMLLSQGKLVYGIGVDDAHHFKEFAPNKSNPGRCWVMVRSPSLSTEEILGNIDAGNFYFTTGPQVSEIEITENSYRIALPSDKATIQFIGNGGEVLKEAIATESEYRFNGDEIYVRVKVISADNNIAWTQPVMINP